MNPAVALADLAHRVSRLVPSHRDPERFHESKSDIVAELRRLAADLRAPPVRPRAAPLRSPVTRPANRMPPDSPRPAPPHQRPAPAPPQPLFAGDPCACSFAAWLLLTATSEVSIAEARKATGLSRFAALCLLTRFCAGLVMERVRLPPAGAGRGRPRIRWRVDAGRLASLLPCDRAAPARPMPGGGADGPSRPNERTNGLRAKPWGIQSAPAGPPA
jgi:hypothetical protein